MRATLEAVLLFHSGSPWTPEKQAQWKTLTGADEATTKVLCDQVREALAVETAAGLAWMVLKNNLGAQARLTFGNCVAVLGAFFTRPA